MINLRNSPFLWFALLLLVAFGITEFIPFEPHGVLMDSFWIISLVCGIICLFRFKPGNQILSTIAIGILIITGGMIRVTSFVEEIFPKELLTSSVSMQGVVSVTEVLKVKEQSITLKCRQEGLDSDSASGLKVYSDKFILVQIRQTELNKVFPGDRFYIQGWVSAFKAPMNPHAFDIRKYYRSIGIRHQISCKGSAVIPQLHPDNSLFRFTAKWQSTLCAIVSAHTSPEVAQLTNALVWGDRTFMNEEIRDAFADSGAMHVLSVSGMHMAMIYSMLLLILGSPGAGTYARRISRFIVYAIAIMLYMGLTGACPAVVRSGLMILLYLLGKAMGWNTPIWNLLGFAAFVMLWINPFVWMNVGFQLSFLAMAGILFYAKPIIRYFSFKTLLLHRTWEITAVSVAAQIFILPVILRQFYQFPLTFIASSLVAMPASYIIIFGSLINISLSVIGIDWFWGWYDIAGRYFILSMKWMAGLNPEMNYSLPALAGLLLFMMAVMFSLALIYLWPVGKRVAYITGISALVALGCHRANQWHTDELIIYHHFKGLLADVIVDGQCISIRDTIIAPGSIEFTTRGNRCHRDVIHTIEIGEESIFTTSTFTYASRVLKFTGTTLLIWSAEKNDIRSDTMYTHLLVDQVKDLNTLKTFVCNNPEMLVILPAHLKPYPKNVLTKFLRENHLSHWDISEQGFFRLTL
ncbi:MAG: ComEC/Rec2 family competence protein [Saprospiraceae bacterium]|nr:ComEC/Rec2 family competence protein [Saprospiraceae bacterium]